MVDDSAGIQARAASWKQNPLIDAQVDFL